MLLAAVSCNKNQTSVHGQVSFGVFSDENVTDVTRSNVSNYTTLPATKDFTITIFDSSSAAVASCLLSEWDAQTPLQAGNYSVTAVYGDLEEEGFDKPYFAGSTNFSITGGATQNVSVPVTLGNAIVKISCTQNFKNYYKDYTFKLTRDGSEIATFTKDETRAVFVDPYKFTVEGTLESETKSYTFSKDYTNLNEATAYTLIFDVDNVGGSSITISFNNNVETVELGDYELND